mmetsp:Transcript_22310/g.51685  ORF Transcript_22310/g.51685 Transcript_22310/m.51685 type:complete len:406 (-) Transcript_22310:185-1402(-)
MTGLRRRVLAGARDPCRLLSTPAHWAQDPDRLVRSSGQTNTKELKGLVQAVLGQQLHRKSEEETLRTFWRLRETRYQTHSGTNDSPTELLRGIFARSQPLKVAAFYLAYCSSLTMGFMHCRFDASSGQPWLLDEVSQVAHYVMQSHSVMQTCTGFLATAVFMTLSFRMNRAASRWWRGRDMCAQMVSSARSACRDAQLCCSDKAAATELSLLAYAAVRATEFHVRLDPAERYREAFAPLLPAPDLEELMQAPHKPHFLLQRFSSRLSDAYDAGHAKNVRLVVAVHSHAEKLTRTLEGIEMLRSTPEPWSYQKHNALLIQLWLALLPVALMPTLLWATPVLGTALGYAVYKLEDVAAEICNPFGVDKSDVSLCLLNDKFQQQLLVELLTWLQQTAVVPPAKFGAQS